MGRWRTFLLLAASLSTMAIGSWNLVMNIKIINDIRSISGDFQAIINDIRSISGNVQATTATTTPVCTEQRLWDLHNRTFNNRTCAEYRKQHPNVDEQCHQNPNDKQCVLNCFDDATNPSTYSPSCRASPNRAKDYHPTDRNQAWPSLDDPGKWILDDKCPNNTNSNADGAPCLLKRFRYVLLRDPQFRPLSYEEACHLLVHKLQIVNVSFYGDSLTRNVAQAMIHWLRRENGKKQPSFGKLTKFREHICNDQVCVRFKQHSPSLRLGHKQFQEYDSWSIYGVGNHPPSNRQSGVQRYGILNLTQYHKLHFFRFPRPRFWEKTASDDDDDDDTKNNTATYFMWMPPHTKLRIWRSDETNERIRQFLRDSSQYFASLGAFTLNTVGMTSHYGRLMFSSCHEEDKNSKDGCVYRDRGGTCERATETKDGFHYGVVTNTWKAQLALHRLMRFAGVTVEDLATASVGEQQ